MAESLSQNQIEEVGRRVHPDVFAEWASDGKFKPFAYQRFFARKIAKAIAGGSGRIIINCPSRHGKSEMCSRWLPIWFIDNCPQKKIALVSYGSELAVKWGREVRNEFDQNQKLLTRLREDSKAADRWNTPEGGGMLSTGIGGPIIGFGGDVVIIDDPHKDWNEAHSTTYRQRVIDWFGSTLYSRVEPKGTIILVMQRMHPEDLAGFLMEIHSDVWDVVSLPAIAEKNDIMGRSEGEALCPERYTSEALKAIQAGMTLGAWEAMFQQRPEEKLSGRAYANFNPAVHEDKTLQLREDLPLQLAFDFNVNPGIHLEVGQYDTIRDMFTAVHEIHGPRMKTGAAMDAFKSLYGKLGKKWTEVQVYGDRSGRTENTTTTITDYHIIGDKLRDMGFKVHMRVPQANPPVKERLISFNDALMDSSGEIHFKVNPFGCPRLVVDLKRVKEDEDGLIDKSDDNLTHPSDACGYQIHAQRRIHKLQRREGQVMTVPRDYRPSYAGK